MALDALESERLDVFVVTERNQPARRRCESRFVRQRLRRLGGRMHPTEDLVQRRHAVGIAEPSRDSWQATWLSSASQSR
ncbi:MAG: hypothetical protein R3C45_06930 [Phycisphaerales bacterium]